MGTTIRKVPYRYPYPGNIIIGYRYGTWYRYRYQKIIWKKLPVTEKIKNMMKKCLVCYKDKFKLLNIQQLYLIYFHIL
jgi:hypothetical protein